MKKIAFVALFFPILAFAHIDKGVWKGVVREGVDCFMEVGEQTFVDNLPHPLNERIQITIGKIEYSVHHPYSINTTDGRIEFNHDLFEGVVATKTGAYALQIKMVHTDAFEGPESLSVMEDNWVDGSNELVVCNSLKKVAD